MRFLRHIFLITFLLPFSFAAEGKIDFPPLTDRVVDEARVISPETKHNLIALLKSHETETGNQLVVVTLNSLRERTIEDYGYQLGRYWAIGQKDKNNGALLILAPNERELRIEVGYGLEETLTDAATKFIIEGVITPKLKENKIDEALYDGAKTMVEILGGKIPEGMKTSPNTEKDFSWWEVLLWIMFILIVGYFRIFLFPGGGGGGGSWGGGGSSGGGGFSGGGGSFGGGGSSGRY